MHTIVGRRISPAIVYGYTTDFMTFAHFDWRFSQLMLFAASV